MVFYITDDYHSIQFKKNSDEVFKRAQELIHAGVSIMAHISTCDINMCTHIQDISVFQCEAKNKEGSGFLSGFAQQIATFLDSMVTR